MQVSVSRAPDRRQISMGLGRLSCREGRWQAQEALEKLAKRSMPMAAGDGWSKTWTYFEGDWHEGNVPIFGPRTHAAWLCSMVFDGARFFEGVTPDLEL